MAITYPVTPPAGPNPASIKWRPVSVVGRNQSQFTLNTEIFAHPGQRWGFEMTLPAMDRAHAAAWMGFQVALNGGQGTFLFGPVIETAPLGTGAGTPVVDGNGQQRSRTLATRGWSASQTVLKAGDWLQLGSGATSRLYMAARDVVSDGSGDAAIEIWPAIRDVLVDGAAIDLTAPKGVFRLTAFSGWDQTAIENYGMQLQAYEVI